MLRYYWSLLRRMPILLWGSAKRWEAVVGVITLCLTALGVSVGWRPWWVVFAPILLLFLYGLLRTNYETFLEVESVKDKLETRLAASKKRRAVKDLLGNAVDEGKNLQRTISADKGELKIVSQQDIEDWVHRTYDLIETAFDKGEAQHFLNSADYKPEKPYPFRNARHDPYRYFTGVRLRRLDELVVRANSLEINPEFNPHSYVQK